MRTHVALLRGINVGGHNRLPMADLRQLVRSLGYAEVATYVQSGNVVFTVSPLLEPLLESPAAQSVALATGVSPADDPADTIRRALADLLSIEATVVVLTRDELLAIVQANPFPEETNHKAVHVVVFPPPSISGPGAPGTNVLDPQRIAEAEARARLKGSRDRAVVAGGALYLWTPDGLGRSVLASELTRRGGPAAMGTARNWATVLALRKLLQSQPEDQA